jgi:hypothetical protein
MLENQKSEIFQIVRKSDLKPEDFHYDEKPGRHGDPDDMPTLTLTHKDTPLKLVIRNSCKNCEDFYIRYTSFNSDYSWVDYTPDDRWNSFDEALKAIEEWIEFEIKPCIKAQQAPASAQNLRGAAGG